MYPSFTHILYETPITSRIYRYYSFYNITPLTVAFSPRDKLLQLYVPGGISICLTRPGVFIYRNGKGWGLSV